ncbi:MAG: sigma-70 family RNA polymerase sigma factor [Saprospiraceae bacterium]|nr:sigma-70 family RNA polymerase sigma factor [Saprospiraceae bacterium]MCB0542046.1 sigma-70 family RNA polymerase sigma factor [Saprospiraceae bacterium]MCB0575859.1 sigma-70 family RNA polymerase sigma factor [Saprospiraceae bacterium]MCB9305623.1 sigma-70 family RNA polymerase sigma factor [Lewinellaceae bacterium]MCB9354132.1 sigma-70 family RNA polymerase sigma factor [Lewinellaceae bacterium]
MTLFAAKKAKDLTDSELISLYLRDQNTVYFTHLYQRYKGKVFAKCISMLADEGLARDATQDIFIKILLNLSKFTEQSSFSTWVYSITYNYCIDMIRRKKKMPLIFTEDVGKVSREADVEIPDSVLLEMKQERLEKVLEKLPPGDKAILMMKYIDDLQIRDIGDILDKSESAIKMQIMRAKQRAQAIYDEMYAGDPIESAGAEDLKVRREADDSDEEHRNDN